MDLVRDLTLCTLKHDFYFSAVHVYGKNNNIADSLSRFQMERFRQLAPSPIWLETHPSPSEQSLSKESQYYLGMALFKNTKKTYSSGLRQFFIFYSHMRITPKLPIDEDTLVNFSVSMARSVQRSTIKNYLSAIKHHHFSHGYELNLSELLRLQLILRGMRRS